jgi:hypothetical protein
MAILNSETRGLFGTLITALAVAFKPLPDHNNCQHNALALAQAEAKSIILTLHCLFPNDILPAFDLLDRGLVARLVPDLQTQSTGTSVKSETEREHEVYRAHSHTTGGFAGLVHATDLRPSSQGEYYVRSSQQTPGGSRFRQAIEAMTDYYEVRLRAWNCTCAAFTFAAFAAFDVADTGDDGRPAGWQFWDQDEAGEHDNVHAPTRRGVWETGGFRRSKRVVPVCKHLLACLLVEECPILSYHVEANALNSDELVGWAAGWA